MINHLSGSAVPALSLSGDGIVPSSELIESPIWPSVTISAAMSLDGKIATKSGRAKLSSSEDLRVLHELRGTADGIMVGVNTILADDPLLTNRSCQGKKPIRIVVDSNCRTPSTSRLVESIAEAPIILACAEQASPERITDLQNRGVKIVKISEDQRGRVDLSKLLTYLASEVGISRLLVEGGSELNWSLVEIGAVSEIRLTIASVILGGKEAKSLVSGEGFEKISESQAFELDHVWVRNETNELVVHYRSKKK